MIQFDNVAKAFSGDAVFKDASFKINRGEKCGLLGRNGSGKTTIIRLILGMESPDEGSINICKHYSLAYLQQHIQFSRNSIREEAALSLRREDKDDLYKVEKVLFGLGFKQADMSRHPKEFSGGYQLRLHLAKALVVEADCLLLDEPTNYLDIVSIRWLIRFLRSWKREFLIISHDRSFVDSITTHTLGVYRQKVHKIAGNTEKFYSRMFQEEEVYRRTLQNREKKRQHLESFISRFGSKATKASQAQSRMKALERTPAMEKLSVIHNLHFQFCHSPFSGKNFVEVGGICFSYDENSLEEEFLISEFSLAIEKGERIAVIGKNGRGKSTLLKLLAREINPLRGGIKIAENVKTAYFSQTNVNRLDMSKSIEEEIASANAELSLERVRNICSLMMFGGDKAKKSISVLSGGERSRTLLGKIIATPCNLLLLDEPTNHLDMESIDSLIEALDAFPGAVIIVTHNEMILRKIPKKLLICREREQDIFYGTYDDFLQRGGWEEASPKAVEKREEGTLSRQERKRRRAQLISERSKILSPIKKKMERLEHDITHLEEEVLRLNQDLVKVSQEGDGVKISEISKSVADKKGRIEVLFSELEEVISQHDKCLSDYHAELEKLTD